MIHTLLVVALVLFVIWILFHAASILVSLLWILIIAAIAIWAVRTIFGVGRRRT